ncbi:MAG: NUDIX hydrolase YfcD [Acidobacteriota bacterium]
MTHDEMVVLVDDRNRITGQIRRWEMRAHRLLHRATYVLVFNSSGQLFVQKRTQTKDVYPGYWDPAAGGVVQVGESYEESAARELSEELGISDVALTRLFDFRFEDEASRVWGRAFSCVYDGDMKFQLEEVEGGEFLAPEEVINRAKSEPFTPDGLYVVQRYLKKE